MHGDDVFDGADAAHALYGSGGGAFLVGIIDQSGQRDDAIGDGHPDLRCAVPECPAEFFGHISAELRVGLHSISILE